MQAIKDYENNKWKVIGQKVGKPAKVRTCFPYPFFPIFPSPPLFEGSPHYRIKADTVAEPFAIYFDFSLRCQLRRLMARGLGPH